VWGRLRDEGPIANAEREPDQVLALPRPHALDGDPLRRVVLAGVLAVNENPGGLRVAVLIPVLDLTVLDVAGLDAVPRQVERGVGASPEDDEREDRDDHVRVGQMTADAAHGSPRRRYAP
jgi:hypothetical protein